MDEMDKCFRGICDINIPLKFKEVFYHTTTRPMKSYSYAIVWSMEQYPPSAERLLLSSLFKNQKEHYNL